MDKRDTLLLARGTAANRGILRSIFKESFNLLEADNRRQALLLLAQNHSCIAAILLDITDFHGDSDSILSDIMTHPAAAQIPTIAITADDSSEAITKAFSLGATDAIPLNYDPYAMHKRVQNIVELHLHKRHLEDLVDEQAAILRHSNEKMVDALSSIIEYRSVESGQHILRIRRFTQILLKEVARTCPEYNLTDAAISIIASASALHDVGKISIPDSVLNKPGKLTSEEWTIMKTHTLTGCHILESLSDIGDQEYLRYAHNICHYHHERWDGRGYPEGIAGDSIPICAQVVGLADAYDALTNKRVYKDAFSFETAVNMILKGECGVFSPKLLECFKHVAPQFEALALAYADGLSPKSEQFSTILPGPTHQRGTNSLDAVQAKYLSLLHYTNAFVAEIDVDQGHYHLIYNPYPELAILQSATTFADTEQLIREHLIVPEEREQLEQFLRCCVPTFLQEGRRRQVQYFHMRSKTPYPPSRYEVTLLRPNPGDAENRRFLLLWRKMEPQAATAETPSVLPSGESAYTLLDGTYCCLNDPHFTMEGSGMEISQLVGYSPDELKELFHNHLIELALPEDRQMIRDSFTSQLSAGTNVELEYRLRHKNGRTIWVLNKSRLILGPDGQEHLYSVLTDITPSRQAYTDLSKKLKRYEIILSQTENVLFDWDIIRDTITFSDTWETIFGYAPLTHHIIDNIFTQSHFHPDDIPLFLDCVQELKSGASYQLLELRIAASSGRYLWCRLRATAIRDQAGQLKSISGIIINIDEEKRIAQALQDRAERDALTKLLNKQAARRQVEEYLSHTAQGASCAMLIIDLDNFKHINDHYGHMFGDAVLSQVAKEIKKLFRAQDIIARIGGDEFMVLMRGLSDQKLVRERCARLIAACSSLFQTQLRTSPLGCSIGIAMAPQHGTSYYDLFQHADQALYQAKHNGRSTFVFYNSADASFLPQRKAVTAVNDRIDSDEQPGLANSSIVQYAFHRLYTADDPEAAVNDILALVGRQTNVSRVYIFENSPDDRFCSNTFEWCNDGIEPEIRNLQDICYETDLPGYTDLFDERGIFYCPDVSTLPKVTYDIVAAQDIKSMLQCAIRDNGQFRGYVGFDDCFTQRMWTKEQIEVLTFFSEMLSTFLLKRQAQHETARHADNLRSILDSQNAWIYVIDPDTCQLKFLNAKTKSLAPHAQEGMLCHKCLMDLDQRCPDCPAHNIHVTKTAEHIICNQKFDLQVLSEATLIQWNGKESCLVTCRQLRAGENG